MTKENDLQVMSEIVQKLNAASKAYYNGEDELMSNYEWDALFDKLTQLEQATGTVLPDSPTHSVGAAAVIDGEKIEHEYPALSLAKTKKVSDLVDWAGERDVWLSLKLDGLTLVATYDGGKLTTLVTRGNGRIGTVITHLAPAIAGVPQTINDTGHLVVRGEALITYANFEAFTLESDEEYANPRNLASGSLTLKDVNEVKKRHLQWVPFTLVHTDEAIVSWGARMDYLETLGFHPVMRERVTPGNLPEAVARWSDDVAGSKIPYPVDGLVICYDDTNYAATGSVTGHHATRAGLAFKWQDTSADTTLTEIEWSCAASKITPVAIFRPVALEGTTVHRATLHNVSECERLGIGGPGTALTVIKANKIIPKVISARGVGTFEIPKTCPVCGAKTEVHVSEAGAKTLLCTNPACAAKQLQKYSRFVSRYAMDIDGLSIETLSKFVNKGYIASFTDIYRLPDHFDAIREMEGFGDRSVDNLGMALDNSREVHAENLIFALCIPMIGVDAARRLTNALGFDGFLSRLKQGERFDDIDGIGPKMSDAITDWYADPETRADLTDLLSYLTVISPDISEDDTVGTCDGLTFVITGKVHQFKNRDAFKAYVLSQGGKVTGSVSKKTDYLINNDVNSTSAKNRKANALDIPILSEDTFIARFGGPENA